MDGQIDGRTDGWTDGHTHTQTTDRRTERRAKALLPLFYDFKIIVNIQTSVEKHQ